MLGHNFLWVTSVFSAVWCVPSSALGQVEWALDTTRIQWGEPLTLTAEWKLTMEEFNDGVADSSAWPMWTDTTNGGLEVLSQLPVDTLAAPLGSGADILLRKEWQLTSWDSGFVVLPPEAFGPHETSPLLIQVLTPALAEDAQPQPPAALRSVEWTFWERLLRSKKWIGLVAFLMALSFLLHEALKRWNNREKTEKTVNPTPTGPPLPAHVLALNVLQPLLHDEGWKRGLAIETQSQASLAVRHYLEGQFGMPAAERTTREIESLLPASAVPKAWHERLVQALEQADAVKFAKGHLPDLTHRALLEAYIQFVLETKPREHEEE